MDEFVAKLEAARRIKPLKTLMEERGRVPANGNWKTFPKCPYCDKTGAGVFNKGHGDRFKCHHTSCPSGTSGGSSAWDEIGFLAYELGVDRSAATKVWLREAGLWTEDRLPPSVLPGHRPRRRAPTAADGTADAGMGDLVLRAVEVLRVTNAVSMRAFREALSLGTVRVSELMDELERRGIIGPARLGQSREILNLPAPLSAPPSSSAGLESPSECLAESPSAMELNSVDDGAATPRSDDDTAHASPGGPPALHGEAPLSSEFKIQNEKLKNDKPSPLPDDGLADVSKVIAFPSGPPPGGGGGGDDEGGGEEEVPEAVKALRWFYERLMWSVEDEAAMWRDRGLTPETCFALGYRSNPQSNKELLLEMAKHFTPAVLEDCGLWKRGDKAGEPLKPNPQFYGMSLVVKRDASGRKVRDEDGEAVVECVWNNPVLIPYFDEHGDLVHLRPHKGMMKDKLPRFYVARPCRAWREMPQGLAAALKRPEFCVVTEGEFKAGALWQAMGDEVSASALPGITMARTLFGEIADWLETVGGLNAVRQVVVGYDNEEKGDESLPGYIEEKRKRYEAAVWARYLAKLLSGEGYDAKVAQLPNEWRNKAGKADWDGRLAALVSREIETSLKISDGAAVWACVCQVAYREFAVVLKASKPIFELWQSGFFDSEEERIIKSRLDRISYRPQLPIGGDDELVLARRLQRLSAKLKATVEGEKRLSGKLRSFLYLLSRKYQDLKGGYYTLKPLKEVKDVAWALAQDRAKDSGDVEVRRACEVARRGVPERVSDFYLKPHYVLNKANQLRHRLVTIHNIHGLNTGMRALPSSAFSQPSKFREWLLDACSGATWRAGERELNDLQADIARDVTFKDVIEVPLRGYHEASRMWFFEDVAYNSATGQEFRPDRKTGIFWIRLNSTEDDTRSVVQGYTFPRDAAGRPRDREGDVFRQGVPFLLTDATKEKPCGEDWPEGVGVHFKDLVVKCYETIGDYGGLAALGIVLGVAAAPEIYDRRSSVASLWTHGEQSQGKTSFVRWLIRIWGFQREKGLPLPVTERATTLTPAALAGALGQYGYLLLWLDEYQTTSPDWVRGILKNIYDRMEGAKRDFGQAPREFLTGAICSGVATSSESQTKSRYVHVQVSAQKRLANHYDWFQRESRNFYKFGRWLMRNRPRYLEAFFGAFQAWMEADSLKNIEDRMRVSHGVAYAGVHAMAEMLGVVLDTTIPPVREGEKPHVLSLSGYWKWLAQHCRESEAEVHETIGVNQFWREIVNALESNAFGEKSSDLRNLFKVVVDKSATARISAQQVKWGLESLKYAWSPLLLYMRPGPVIDMLRKYGRQKGTELPLDQSDLQSQMKTRPYWKHPMRDGKPLDMHRQKFGDGSKSVHGCWCIALDWHEMGLQAVSDEDFEASFHVDGDVQGDFIASENWTDPRRGDLFALVEALKPKETPE